MSSDSSCQTIKTKSDALYEITKKYQNGEYKTEGDVHEAWLRWFIYGDLEKRTPCTIYETFMSGDAYNDKFPSAFVKQLIEHLITCDDCGKLYYDYSHTKEIGEKEK